MLRAKVTRPSIHCHLDMGVSVTPSLSVLDGAVSLVTYDTSGLLVYLSFVSVL